MRTMLAAALTALLGLSGCVHPHSPAKHPHGMPPGQVKKALYRCGHCSATSEASKSCHGKIMILVP